MSPRKLDDVEGIIYSSSQADMKPRGEIKDTVENELLFLRKQSAFGSCGHRALRHWGRKASKPSTIQS